MDHAEKIQEITGNLQDNQAGFSDITIYGAKYCVKEMRVEGQVSLLLGYDLGSSFIKGAVVDGQSGKVLASAQAPQDELMISSLKPGWAEQDPRVWWNSVVEVTARLSGQVQGGLKDISAVGISYQMHGLVLVDKDLRVIRPSIIWCDGRAVSIGEKAAYDLGYERCLRRLCNLPGNFTASKLRWVREHELDNYIRIHKMLLPGDYLAMCLSGNCTTTYSGLSEAILWDYEKEKVARDLLDYYQVDRAVLPNVFPNLGVQATISREAAAQLGLPSGIPISYRSGDQPNNALSLNVFKPGETAVTAGTSGVVYCVVDKQIYDLRSRVNPFLHVNHTSQTPRYGALLCISGTGRCNSFFRTHFTHAGSGQLSYDKMNELASEIAPGADGLFVIPFGNGPERVLENADPGASVHGLRFATHSSAHCARAAQEGVAFAFNYGTEVLREMGCSIDRFRAGNANMFKSKLFTDVLSNVTNVPIELFDTDGSQGAARGAGIGAGLYSSPAEAFESVSPVGEICPDTDKSKLYRNIYEEWKSILNRKRRGQ